MDYCKRKGIVKECNSFRTNTNAATDKIAEAFNSSVNIAHAPNMFTQNVRRGERRLKQHTILNTLSRGRYSK